MERGKGKYMRLHFLVLIIQTFDNVLSCPASIPTISNVSYCPTSQEEWEKAAKRKNCESIAVIQNCTTRSKFQYHCLMNHWKNATLEVCAPIFYLQGYCAEYNIQIKQVAEIYDKGFECLKFPDKHKCPPRYPSNEAYKYQRCYRKKITNLPTKKFTNSSKDNSVIPLVFILIVLLLFGIVASVIVMLNEGICDKLTKGCKQTNKNSEQNEKDETGEEAGLLKADRNVKDNSDVQAEEITITKKETENQAPDLKEEVKIAVEKQENSTTDNNQHEDDESGNDRDEKQSDFDITDNKGKTEKPSLKSKRAPAPPTNVPIENVDKKLAKPEQTTIKDTKLPPPRPTTRPKRTASNRCSDTDKSTSIFIEGPMEKVTSKPDPPV